MEKPKRNKVVKYTAYTITVIGVLSFIPVAIIGAIFCSMAFVLTVAVIASIGEHIMRGTIEESDEDEHQALTKTVFKTD